MKIAVIGLTGRMNTIIIEEIISRTDCSLSGVLARKKVTNSIYPITESIEELAKNSDAIIDFTCPATSVELAKKLANLYEISDQTAPQLTEDGNIHNLVYVCGTTGFTSQEFEEFKDHAKHLTTIWSPNMSVGINILQTLLKNIAKALGDEFDAGIIDIHHKHKKDAPSGTAILLGNLLKEITHKEAQISALRIGEVPGKHQIIFTNANESITLIHTAFNRKIFANGAIKACLWGKNKPKGLYSMQDVLNLDD